MATVVKEKIADLAEHGIRDATAIQQYVSYHVKNEVFPGEAVPASNWAFKPTKKDVFNAMRASTKIPTKEQDFGTLEELISVSRSSGLIYFQLPESDEPLLLVHQSEWQMYILARYNII